MHLVSIDEAIESPDSLVVTLVGRRARTRIGDYDTDGPEIIIIK